MRIDKNDTSHFHAPFLSDPILERLGYAFLWVE